MQEIEPFNRTPQAWASPIPIETNVCSCCTDAGGPSGEPASAAAPHVCPGLMHVDVLAQQTYPSAAGHGHSLPSTGSCDAQPLRPQTK
jgi:hypothetical protein